MNKEQVEAMLILIEAKIEMQEFSLRNDKRMIAVTRELMSKVFTEADHEQLAYLIDYFNNKITKGVW